MSYPLVVTFVGEPAMDMGGPRREFFSLLLCEIDEMLKGAQQPVDDEDIIALSSRSYSAGALCG